MNVEEIAVRSAPREAAESSRRPTLEAPALVAGTAHPALAVALAEALGEPLVRCDVERFPDGELTISVDEEVRGRDVYVVQPTMPPVGENILELVLVADALHRAGAERVTAVIPYFGFARQERRVRRGEPLGARVVADLVSCGRFARLVAIDLHAPAVEGFFSVPLEHITAIPLLAEAVRPWLRDDTVIVSPDLGGAKLARQYSRLLDRPVAVVHKKRLDGRSVEVHDVTGDVSGRPCIIVDDLVSTGGTIAAAVSALRDRGASDDLVVVASHTLMAGSAADVLSRAGVRRLIGTDTIPPRSGGTFERIVVSVAPLLADAIRRMARGRTCAMHLGPGRSPP